MLIKGKTLLFLFTNACICLTLDAFNNLNEISSTFLFLLFQLDKNLTDSEKIHDEVHEQVSKCTCVKQFRIHKIGEGKYRVRIKQCYGMIVIVYFIAYFF